MNAPGIRPLPALAIAAAILVVGSRLFPAMWSEVPEAPRRSAQSRTAERVARTQPPQVGPANRAQALAVHGAGGRLTGDDSLTTGSLPNRATAAPARDLSARVVIKAEQTVALSAELNARILRIPFKEGDRFQAGAVLIEFDCQRIRAELAASTAALKLNRNAHDTVSQLQKLGSAGVYNVRQAQFEMEKAAADVDNLKAKQTTCLIRAPFDGIVAERLAAAHEVVSPNQPVLRIVDTAEPELQLIVPSAWMTWMVPGRPFSVEIDETGRSHAAVVRHVSGAVDPISQTVRVIARLEGGSGNVMPGMSGIARFRKDTPAAKSESARR